MELQPGEQRLPEFLRGHRFDAIARRHDENVVIEVKRGVSIESAALESLARAVEEHPGWRLELVALPSREPEHYWPPAPSLMALERRLELAKSLLKSGDSDLAVLGMWTFAEAILRNSLADFTQASVRRTASPLALAKTAFSYGVIGPSDLDLLEKWAQMRNQTAHGFPLEDAPTSRYLVALGRVLKRLLAQLSA